MLLDHIFFVYFMMITSSFYEKKKDLKKRVELKYQIPQMYHPCNDAFFGNANNGNVLKPGKCKRTQKSDHGQIVNVHQI